MRLIGTTVRTPYARHPVARCLRALSAPNGCYGNSHGAVDGIRSPVTALANSGYATAYFGKWHVPVAELDEVENSGFQTIANQHNVQIFAGRSCAFAKRRTQRAIFYVASFNNPIIFVSGHAARNLVEWRYSRACT